LREEIGQALGRYDAATAAEKYRRLIEVDPEHVLARKELLDIANQLMSEQRHPQAAEAYEKYLRHYPDASQVEQVQLLLGILYIRYLNRPDRALELLRQARKNLTNSGQITLCDDQIRRLENP